MRAVWGFVVAVGGLWLMWLIVTGHQMPWETSGTAATSGSAKTPSSTSKGSSSGSTSAPPGTVAL